MSLTALLGNTYRLLLKVIHAPFMALRKSRIAYSARIGRGAIVVHSQVGQHSYIAEGVYLNHTNIGNYCSIAAGTKIGGMEHAWWWGSTSPRLSNLGITDMVTTVGDDVWIGANVAVRQGIRIGRGAVIGAGSVVLKDVEPYAIVGGVPAKLIRMRFPEGVVADIEATRFWELPPAEATRALNAISYPPHTPR